MRKMIPNENCDKKYGKGNNKIMIKLGVIIMIMKMMIRIMIQIVIRILRHRW